MDTIPPIGFGTYKLNGQTCHNSVLEALKAGYRHIDTANLYKNEAEVGQAIEASGVPRGEVWITTKIHWRDIKKGRDAMNKSVVHSLTQLQTDYIDLLLLHNPVDDKLVESWQVMEEIVGTGKVRFIGVSNYTVEQLAIVLDNCKIKPYANQFEITPFYNRPELIQYCKSNGIIAVAHTSLVKGEKFDDDRLVALSRQSGISKPLLLLAWALKQDLVVLPRSCNVEHIKENLESLGVVLDDGVLETMDEFHDG